MKKQCKNCGANFLPCSSCIKSKTYYGWRKDFCSTECFQIYMKQAEVSSLTDKKINGVSIRGKIRGKVYDENKMSDIVNYQFDDLKGNFVDHYGVERNIYDYQYLYITHEILEDVFNEIYQLGVQEGKSKNKLSKQKIEK